MPGKVTKDPAWLAIAERFYSASLYLLPRELRNQYGSCMRQAFRDRCREVARGERSALRVLAVEMIPDLLMTVGREQVHDYFGNMRARQILLLGLLCLSSAYLLFGEASGMRLSDLAFNVHQRIEAHRVQRETEALTTRLDALAGSLASVGSTRSKALAAYVYRFSAEWALRADGQLDPHESPRADALAKAALAEHPEAYTLAVLTRQCVSVSGCKLAAVAAHRLAMQDPANGYPWTVLFRQAVLAHDQPAMRHALAEFAKARRYNAFEGELVRDLLAAAEVAEPADPDTRYAAWESLVDADWRAGLEGFHALCDDSAGTGWRTHVTAADRIEARADCLKAGKIMSSATRLDAARRGNVLVYRLSTDESERAAALSRLREIEWLDRQVTVFMATNEFAHYPDEAPMWLATAAYDQGELPSIAHWLALRGRSSMPPDSYSPSASQLAGDGR